MAIHNYFIVDVPHLLSERTIPERKKAVRQKLRQEVVGDCGQD